jgi:Tat protein secretion system quality control protein TatD with DNase activity
VGRVVETLADVHGVDRARLAQQTALNFRSLFRP